MLEPILFGCIFGCVRRRGALLFVSLVCACGGSRGVPASEWIGPARATTARAADAPVVAAAPSTDLDADPPSDGDSAEAPVEIRLHGRPPVRAVSSRVRDVAPVDLGPDLFRNTYYDFPREGGGARDAAVYDPTCAPIARVTTSFHDALCVQGSGRLASGGTVAFARRDCACAAVCPRTGERICYELLDAGRFPTGRGATGHPITPLRTVAVDTAVIGLGTVLYIPELAGMPKPDGSRHDGCFVAEDRGIRVVGRQIDVFTGDPAVTTRWNALFPSNRGVHAIAGDAHCAR